MLEDDLAQKLKRLETTDGHAERHVLALELSGTGDRRVFSILVQPIQRPDLANYRGTLVYCLGEFDCSEAFQLLDILATDNSIEVASAAQGILDEQRPK